MLWGSHQGGLEIRRKSGGSVSLGGRFPYGKTAVLSDGGRTGRPRKERIASRAFSYRVEEPEEDIHLLVGHSYDRPLASRGAGTLVLEDTAEALTFTATIAPAMQEVSYVRDVLAAIDSGLILGLSPGFRLPPRRAVPVSEKITDEGSDPANGKHNAIIRTVLQALLYELSLVTRPAYPEAQIESRNWQPEARPARSAAYRWRA
ncbi:HK97 family phage prohead protease [Mameliella alba]|uniref:HK97 family phage prohead protease n=1 Tax=Mameliella alba TaxID=561184 RepID=UPI001C96EA8C|nr:HK97 family phage prohead protease [Mameliella alba]MBY6119820.1 HK97 family phage prohead protease [Mameliella alba]